MTSFYKVIINILLCALLIACGGNSSNGYPVQENPQPSADSEIFPLNDLWGSEVYYEKLDTADKTEVSKIRQNSLGTTCFLFRETTLENASLLRSSWKSTLNCKDSDQELILNISRQDTGMIKDFLFLPDGSVVVAELVRPIDELVENPFDFHFELHLSHYSEFGVLYTRQILEDEPTDKELLLYQNSDASLAPETTPGLVENALPQLHDRALVKLAHHNNTLYLLAYTYGVKLYQLNQNLTRDWDVQVLPGHSGLWAAANQNMAELSFNAEGEVFVGLEVFAAEAEMYRSYFNRPLEKEDNSGDILVAAYTPNGAHIQSLILGTPDYDEKLVGLALKEKTLWLAANVRHNSNNQDPGNSNQWDLLLAAYDIENRENLSYALINFDQEEKAKDFLLLDNGNFLFTGHSGFQQADSESQTSYSAGFIAEINSSGTITQAATLNAPRNVQLTTSQMLASGEVIFSGVYDGPIPLSCNDGSSLCTQKGVMGKLSLQAVNP